MRATIKDEKGKTQEIVFRQVKEECRMIEVSVPQEPKRSYKMGLFLDVIG